MITAFSSTPISPTVWRLTFASDLPDPTFYVWLDGRLFGSTSATMMDVPVGISQVAQVDAFDDAGDTPDAVYPSTVTLRWEVGTQTALSRVEQWDGEAWVVRGQVPATGAGIGRWESAPLDDGATVQFRVVPVDGTGRDGIAREFSGLICRWPDAPTLTVAVVGGEFDIS